MSVVSQTGLDNYNDHLKIFSFRTQKWSDLEVGEAQYPTFSHDGRFVEFVRWTDDHAVFRVRVSDGKVERVVDTNGLPMTSTFGIWMGFDTTDAPVFLRDRGTSDVYALTLEEK